MRLRIGNFGRLTAPGLRDKKERREMSNVKC